MENNLLEITFIYENKRLEKFTEYLSASDYFDPIEPHECFDIDSVPKHISLIDYIDINKDDVRYIEVKIADQNKKTELIEKEIFCKNTKVSISHKIENKLVTYTEYIIELLESNGNKSQILKIGESLSETHVISHSLLFDIDKGVSHAIDLLK